MNSSECSEQPTRFEVLARGLEEFRPDTEYFAATLHKSDSGWTLAFFTRWTGFPDDGGLDEGIELRKAVPVEPENYSQVWKLQDQGWIAVNGLDGLLVFMAIGGNAFIAEDIARERFKQDLEPHAVTRSGGGGFWSFNPNSREVRMHRPTPKQRQRILGRDGRRCQICGRKPSAEKDIDLHVHHIKPFSQGGLTIDENLITLCRQCHQGLIPHYQPELFWGADGSARNVNDQVRAETHGGGIEAHHQRVASLLRELANQG